VLELEREFRAVSSWWTPLTEIRYRLNQDNSGEALVGQVAAVEADPIVLKEVVVDAGIVKAR
jgi:hypothetical protein